MTTVGILGGGQLARMLVLAGAPLGLRFKLLDPAADACAGQLAPLAVGAWDAAEALRSFVEGVDIATFDFENVPAPAAQWLAATLPVFPPPQALAVSQDRLSEKNRFRELGIPVAPFAAVDSLDGLRAAVAAIGLPAILKTRRLGYDGKGQFRLRTLEDVDAAWAALGPQAPAVGLILEGFVAFQRELSVVAARGKGGEFRAWPLTRNWHVDGVLSASLAPAPVNPSTREKALAYAKALAESLDYVGVFALELFECDDELLANEMAPRVHNSGHWTIEGSQVSQFENHLRAGLGLPLGSTAMRGHACMLNWLGTMPDRAAALAVPGLRWHDYGKQPRPGRKVGHATVCADSPAELAARLEQLGSALDRQAQVAPVVACLLQGSR
ncbi:MAG: 5-(carboxyamino)imidazole ribonucleotide synthase [Thermomonas sp.]|uniref:5-(carboxyamino)imidazole ribonucleotide synthase n=1 Tax=Thermomonas sp. TaxID=1971895 RepID=UPI001D279683|nr:5-(carboxyamino)imidazole ribonucleotide synthase [Thermomonas sp.]MBZ0086800.1 5-(carboxyamino)imidazole ribonucleotide synthase [Thermomonas sp.]